MYNKWIKVDPYCLSNTMVFVEPITLPDGSVHEHFDFPWLQWELMLEVKALYKLCKAQTVKGVSGSLPLLIDLGTLRILNFGHIDVAPYWNNK